MSATCQLAQAIVVLAHAVVLLVAPPGAPIASIADLKRMSVGVVGGEISRKVVEVPEPGVRSRPRQC